MSTEDENMEMDEIDLYDNLDKPIYKKKVTKKPQKSNKKLLAFALITIAFIVFIILAYLNQKGNINSKIFEKNEKSDGKKWISIKIRLEASELGKHLENCAR